MKPQSYNFSLIAFIFCTCLTAIFCQESSAQAGRNLTSARRSTVVPLYVKFTEDATKPKPLLGSNKPAQENERILTKDKLELHDAGIPQKIESLSPDSSPARIVVLLDNSASLQTDIKKLAAVPAAFAPEIYEGDKVMVIGYDLKPEIITDFTDKPEELQNTLGLLRKSDTPRLFDALDVVMEDVMRPAIGYSKRVIVLVSDGLDRDSKIKYDRILNTLQDENVTVYAIQVKDRTRGALRKDSPKPVDCLEQLTASTGGKIFSVDGDIKSAVKEICDELRNERYQLTYYPEGVNYINKRLLLLTSSDGSLQLRTKYSHPPHQY